MRVIGKHNGNCDSCTTPDTPFRSYVMIMHVMQLFHPLLYALTEAPSPIPFTLEHLLSKLLPHASKWQSLGEALSLDDDRLDEIYTNNETDEACLQEMLEVYVARSDLNHNWDEIQEAIKMIPGGGAIQAGIISCKFQLPLCIPVLFDRLEQLGVPIVCVMGQLPQNSQTIALDTLCWSLHQCMSLYMYNVISIDRSVSG